MATYTYAIEKGDAVSRARRDIGDTDVSDNGANARFSDEDILSVHRETALADFLAIEFPSSYDAVTVVGATVEVVVGSDAVEAVFRRIQNQGTAQAGGASSITLAADASSVDDAYNGLTVRILTGPAANKSAVITDYDGATKLATVASAWSTQPTSASTYQVLDVATFETSVGVDYDKVIDLMDGVEALDRGWDIRLGTRAEGEIIEWLVPDFTTEPRTRVALGRSAGDLAITYGELDVYGQTRRLSIYNPSQATARLRRLQLLDPGGAGDYREGDVSWGGSNVTETLKATATPAAIGVFTRVP